eukprot:scaffold269149_cov13-Prasinocladus_malaysianus.AAC.1
MGLELCACDVSVSGAGWKRPLYRSSEAVTLGSCIQTPHARFRSSENTCEIHVDAEAREWLTWQGVVVVEPRGLALA